MSDLDDILDGIEVRDGDGDLLTFEWDKRPAAWCCKDFRIQYDGYGWQAMLITYNPRAEVLTARHYASAQEALDALCASLHRFALAAGMGK